MKIIEKLIITVQYIIIDKAKLSINKLLVTNYFLIQINIKSIKASKIKANVLISKI